MLAAIGASLVLSLLYLLFASPVYTIKSSLYVAGGPQLDPNARPADRPYLNTQTELLTSTPILAIALGEQLPQDQQMFEGVENRIEYLKKQIETSIGKEDELITVSLDSKYPDQATRFLSSVVDAYLNYRSAQRKTTATELLEVLQKQRAQVAGELSAKSHEMVEFKRTHGTLSFNQENDSIVMKSLESLSDAVIAARLRTLAAKAAFEEAKRLLPPGTDLDARKQIGAMALDEKSEADLQAALSSWEQKLQELNQNYLPDHPLVQGVRTRVENLRVAYVASLQRHWDVARQMEADLQATYDQQQKSALDQAGRATEYSRLEADVRRLERAAEGLDSRINDLSLAEDANAVDIKVLEPSSASPEPTSPRKLRTLAVALVLGLFAGLAVASAQELTDPRLRSDEQIDAALGLPVLAAIPAMPPAFSQMMRAQSVVLEPRSDVADAFRMVRTGVYYARPDHPKVRTILVTSPGQEEGKTTLASNLAIVMAMTRERVLLLDADMRRPSQHRMFEIPNDLGLSSVLENEGESNGADESGWEHAIVPTDIKNLDILPCGPVPIDPAGLLNSPKFSELLEQLSARYDRIVLDAPPVLMAPDARILASSCDATVLIARARRLSRKACEMACDDLVSVGAHLVGVVVNDVRPGSGFANSSSRMHGYGYGSGTMRNLGSGAAAAASAATNNGAGAGAGRDGVDEAPMADNAPLDDAVESVIRPVQLAARATPAAGGGRV